MFRPIRSLRLVFRPQKLASKTSLYLVPNFRSANSASVYGGEPAALVGEHEGAVGEQWGAVGEQWGSTREEPGYGQSTLYYGTVNFVRRTVVPTGAPKAARNCRILK